MSEIAAEPTGDAPGAGELRCDGKDGRPVAEDAVKDLRGVAGATTPDLARPARDLREEPVTAGPGHEGHVESVVGRCR